MVIWTDLNSGLTSIEAEEYAKQLCKLSDDGKYDDIEMLLDRLFARYGYETHLLIYARAVELYGGDIY